MHPSPMRLQSPTPPPPSPLQQAAVGGEAEGTGTTWSCRGFAPLGGSWQAVAPGLESLWAIDCEGRLWMHIYYGDDDANGEGVLARWTCIAAPRVSEVSCSPGGEVGMLFHFRLERFVVTCSWSCTWSLKCINCQHHWKAIESQK